MKKNVSFQFSFIVLAATLFVLSGTGSSQTFTIKSQGSPSDYDQVPEVGVLQTEVQKLKIKAQQGLTPADVFSMNDHGVAIDNVVQNGAVPVAPAAPVAQSKKIHLPSPLPPPLPKVDPMLDKDLGAGTLDPSGKFLYAVGSVTGNYGAMSDVLDKIDLSTNLVAKRLVLTPKLIEQVVTTPDGRGLYLVVYNAATNLYEFVTVDPVTFKVTQTLPLPGSSTPSVPAVQIDPSGQYAFFSTVLNANTTTVRLTKIALKDNSITTTQFPGSGFGGSVPVVFDPSGAYGYVAAGLDIVKFNVNDLTQAAPAMTIPTDGDGPVTSKSLAIDASGKFIYCAMFEGYNSVPYRNAKVDLTTGKVALTLDYSAPTNAHHVFDQNTPVVIDPQGTYVYFGLNEIRQSDFSFVKDLRASIPVDPTKTNVINEFVDPTGKFMYYIVTQNDGSGTSQIIKVAL